MENGLNWLVYAIPRGQPRELVAGFAMRDDAEDYADEYIRGDHTDAVVEEAEREEACHG